MSTFSRLPRAVAVSLLAVLCALAIDARATVGIVLTNGNSVVNIDPFNQMGMNTWYVDGQNQLYQQWFWYRVGSNAEKSIDSIGAPVIVQNSASQVTSTYTSLAGGFSVSIVYNLLGGANGSGQSTVNEAITINNTTASPLNFHFFQYSDYNLGGVDQDIVQIQAGFGYALVKSGALSLGEVVTSPSANNGEVAPYNQTLLKLNNPVADNLNGSLGPLGPGDNTFAFQWDFTIGANDSQQISKIKSLQVQVVPEPTTSVLALFGVGILISRRFFKK
jgi:hypothetical protein